MAATDFKTLSELIYFGRIQHYGHMKFIANNAIEKYGRDPILVFFRAFAHLLEFNLQEAIQDLELVKNDESVELCALMALIVAYKEQSHTDREAVAALDEKLKEKRKVAGDSALRFAGLFLALSSRPDKALQYADRMIKLDANSFDGFVLRGWLCLLESQVRPDRADELRKRAQKDFETADELPHDSGNELELSLGKSKLLELNGEYQKATQALLGIRQANFAPKLNELMRLELAMGKWDSAFQSASEIANDAKESTQLFALSMLVLYKIAYDGSYTEASNDMRKFFDVLHQKEAQNMSLYVFYCKLFSTLCGRNMLILRQTNSIMHSLITSFEKTSASLIEYANQMLMAAQSKEDVEAAMKVFIKAMEVDPDNSRAMLGFNHCKILLSKTKEFEKIFKELELLKETMIATASTQEEKSFVAEVMYVQALILQHKNKFEEVGLLLRKAFEYHQQSFTKVCLSPEYLYALNIDFRMQIVRCLVKCFSPEPLQAGKDPPMVMVFAKNVLDVISGTVPGLTEAKFYQAKIKYYTGDLDGACNILQDCIDRTKEADMSEADMLLANILVEMNQVSRAEQCLSTALSLNFAIRQTASYHIVKAKIQAKSNQMTECRKTLEAAINLPGVRKITSRQGSAGVGTGARETTTLVADSDRLSIFLDLSEALRAENNVHEAAKIMQDAINEFRGTSEESRVMIANANLDLSRGDTESALSNLKKIESDKPYYIQAREKMAEIYLNHRNDKRLYAQCYKDLVEKQPNARTKMLLGDAYMNILEIDKAVMTYQSAYQENQSDVQIIKKIAQASVKMHYYTQAIQYYRSAYKKDASIKHDLVALLIRLHQYDEALKLLDEAEPQEQTYDLTRLIDNSKCLIARSKICKSKKQIEQYETYLKKAQIQQREVLRRVKAEQPELNTEQIDFALHIVNELAELAIDKGNLEEAIELYERAAKFKDRGSDTKMKMKIIKLYMQTGNLEECETQCVNLIKEDLDNREAMTMMAELMLAKNNFQEAHRYYTKLVEQSPSDFTALHQTIRCYRFMGDLKSADKLFTQAKEFSSKVEMEPGFFFCKGYYELHLGNANNALKEFNKCRKDKTWGPKALKHMIEICLNPHNTVMGADALDEFSGSNDEMSSLDETDSISLRTAAKLLVELKSMKDTSDHAILDAYLSLATKHGGHVNEAIAKFNNLVAVKPVAAYLGIATGYLLKKDKEAARGTLKKIVRESTWSIEDADDFEKAFILYADRAMASAKPDVAIDVLQQCLKYNRSCFKAYEYLGLMQEKDSKFQEASDNYELAWNYCYQNDPAIGYKLAYNYLKAKKYIEAIDVCHAVLDKNPNYPKIRKEILEKARNNFRA